MEETTQELNNESVNNSEPVLEDNQLTETSTEVIENNIDRTKLQLYFEKLKMEQNLPLAIIAGIISAIVGGAIWAAITVATEYQIGYMAVAVGFIVGFAVKILGKGIDKIFGIIGAVFALFGCVLGNFFSIVGFASNEIGLSFFQTLGVIDFSLIPEVLMESFSPMDLLFYGIAIYEGYRFSFRQVTEDEVKEHASLS